MVGKTLYLRDFGFLFLSGLLHFTAAFFQMLSKSWYNKATVYAGFLFWGLQIFMHIWKIARANRFNLKFGVKNYFKIGLYLFLFVSFCSAPIFSLLDYKLSSYEGPLTMTFLILSVLPFRYGFNHFFRIPEKVENSTTSLDGQEGYFDDVA